MSVHIIQACSSGVSVKLTLLDAGDERLPGVRAEGQVATVMILGVADRAGACELCDLYTVVAATVLYHAAQVKALPGRPKTDLLTELI